MFAKRLEKFTMEEQKILNLRINQATRLEPTNINDINVKHFVNEFWTAKQRQGNSIHEISYRACFKPQLPQFFIKRLTREKDVVYDPFLGRGTTIIEAGLLNRQIIGNDINPLSIILSEPRFLIPEIKDLSDYLDAIPFYKYLKANIDLSMFYHPKTESQNSISKKLYLKQTE